MKEQKKRDRAWLIQNVLSSTLSRCLFTTIVLCLFLFGLSAGYTAEITLLWDKNTETDIEGYKVYSRVYGSHYTNIPTCQVDSNWNSCTFNDAEDGKIHYFAVKAYNTEGLESKFSNEVSYKAKLSPISSF